MPAAAVTGLVSLLLFTGLLALVLTVLPRRQPSLQRVCAEDEGCSQIALSSVLRDSDARFVASMHDKRLLERFLAHRRAVFSTYLNEMTNEFNRLSALLKRHAADAERDRSDLVVWLMKETLRFRTAIALQRLCLTLHWADFEASPRLPELSLDRVRQHALLVQS